MLPFTSKAFKYNALPSSLRKAQSSVPVLFCGSNSMTALSLLLLVSAYLMGSIMGALVINRAFDIADPRTAGSGNPGASNMLRNHGKKAGFLTLVIDVIKGIIPVVIGKLLSQPDWMLGALGLAAFVGHLFPLFYRFQGGKGVATALGIILVLSPSVALGVAVTWGLVFILSRISALSSLSAAIVAPLLSVYFAPSYLPVFSFLTILIFWKHADNIKRLFKGEEPRFKSSNSK